MPTNNPANNWYYYSVNSLNRRESNNVKEDILVHVKLYMLLGHIICMPYL